MVLEVMKCFKSCKIICFYFYIICYFLCGIGFFFWFLVNFKVVKKRKKNLFIIIWMDMLKFYLIDRNLEVFILEYGEI